MPNRKRFKQHSRRIPQFDYSSTGLYFVTICTHNMSRDFGEIVAHNMELSEIGKIAEKYWEEIPNHFKEVSLLEFVVMPNHVHGIIEIQRPNHHVGSGQCPDPTMGYSTYQHVQKNSLPSIIGSYKAAVRYWCLRNNYPSFRWQPNYYEHVIRREESLENITHYICDNPLKWENDEYFNDW
ncbi:transposase [Candidatus Cerribacteria bacterium 'Amazon FNV 2010 28 9']|uniref:Transposase n=1 Tax=Candidatus Cerribacteria bacterium 'Amazon FNV 2010 28 9' TaxID=2081795 RepID=A0A317JQ35_9BACT|nr:MAG: transposase [Candidatus Cerribacteria bacterium 'Amazon FNV 2010 28 9']